MIVAFFIDWHTSYSVHYVNIANSSIVPIHDAQSIVTSSTMKLHNALYFPSFPIDLLSIVLNKFLQCLVALHPTHCVFQDLQMKVTIGRDVRMVHLSIIIRLIESPPLTQYFQWHC